MVDSCSPTAEEYPPELISQRLIQAECSKLHPLTAGQRRLTLTRVRVESALEWTTVEYSRNEKYTANY